MIKEEGCQEKCPACQARCTRPHLIKQLKGHYHKARASDGYTEDHSWIVDLK